MGLVDTDATIDSSASLTFTGAKTVYGAVSLKSDKPFTLTPGDNGFNTEGDFSTLGFQEGTYGGQVANADSKLTPPRTGRLSFHVGAGATQTIHIDLADYGSKGPITSEVTSDVALSNTDQRTNRIDTADAARTMLGKLDMVLDRVNGDRARMGAVMNRLDYVMDNLTNVSTNTQSSRSQIEDADYAKASTDLARTQIMQQAATAVLAQANTSQQNVLKLLQG
jgi:flagellin